MPTVVDPDPPSAPETGFGSVMTTFRSTNLAETVAGLKAKGSCHCCVFGLEKEKGSDKRSRERKRDGDQRHLIVLLLGLSTLRKGVREGQDLVLGDELFGRRKKRKKRDQETETTA